MANVPQPALPPLARPHAPWQLLFRAIGIAFDWNALALAGLGLLALTLGWKALALAFPDSPWLQSSLVLALPGTRRPMVVYGVLGSFLEIFRADVSAWSRIGAVSASAWTLLVWGLFGGAIVRIGVTRMAGSEAAGAISALRFSAARLGSLVAAPLTPLLVAGLFALAGAAIGLLDRIPGGTGPAAALAFVPLLIGLLDAVILLLLALAWPLMIATVITENEDFFDAISRSYSYVNQRFALYAGYLALAGILGAIGLGLVVVFLTAALGLADWSVSLGAPQGVGFRFLNPDLSITSVGDFWSGLVNYLVVTWIYSYAWSAASVIYLLLRLDVDGKDIHEIYRIPPAPAAPLAESAKTADAEG
jgi:hypothetical protein